MEEDNVYLMGLMGYLYMFSMAWPRLLNNTWSVLARYVLMTNVRNVPDHSREHVR